MIKVRDVKVNVDFFMVISSAIREFIISGISRLVISGKLAVSGTLLLLIFSIFPMQAIAESRNIYVGDLIDIKVITKEFSRSELEEKFKDFEIVSINEDREGFLITLRTFETGEKKIQLGDKEIIIDVKSTLDDIQRDDVFEGSLDPEEAGFSVEWRDIFYLLLAIMLVSGCISFRKYLAKRKIRILTPFEQFVMQINSIPLDDDNFFVKLTAGLKEYIESAYSCCIRGKTSTELVNAISGLPGLYESLPAIRSWLTECDRLKFTGVKVSKEKRQAVCSELIELVKKIDEKNGEFKKAKGVAS